MDITKPSSIKDFVWKAIDTDLSLKRDLSRGIINIRSLAQYLIEKNGIKVSIDSVISAIRRYNLVPEKKSEEGSVYSMLKKAKIKTFTKMAYISLKKNEDVTLKLARLLPEVNFEAGEVLRVLEGSKIFKLIIDENSYPKIFDLFGKNNVIESKKKIGMIEMIYPDMLKEVPGVFSVISTELGASGISIIDALICSNEHVIVVDETNILKSFQILFEVCS
jgi:hypothetical protein